LNVNDRKNVINAAELVSRQWRPRTWLLWQMIPMGGITLLAGETASGKTILALDLALGLASGRGRAWDMEIDVKQTFGTSTARCAPSIMTAFPTGMGLGPIRYASGVNPIRSTSGAGHVRYFCRDADPHLLAERIDRLCRGYHPDQKTSGIEVPVNLDFDFSTRVFSEPTDFTWLQNEIEKKGYQLLVFDSLAQYLPAMADGSARAVGAFLGGLRQLVSHTGVTILILHQFNKRLPSRTDKWGLPISQGEERVRGSSELLAGVDTALLVSRPEAIRLGNRSRIQLKVVKNRLGQPGAHLQFTIVDGEPTNAGGIGTLPNSLHLLFEPHTQQAQVKPRRLVDAAFDELMKILMKQDAVKFDRRELVKLLQEQMFLPGSRVVAEAFNLLGKDERVKVERNETGKKLYSWAEPGTGQYAHITYGLPPLEAIDLMGKYMLTKAQMRLVDHQIDKMTGKKEKSEIEQKIDQFISEQESADGKAAHNT